MTKQWRVNPHISTKRYTFNIGDKVRIDDNIVGVTLIDRGKTYTIENFYDKKPCAIFRDRYDDEFCMSFVELPNHWFKEKYFYLVTPAKGHLDEELFTL